MRNYANYTDYDIIKYAKEVESLSGLLKKLNLKPVGGNYSTIKRKLKTLNLDCEHWTGQGWNAGERMKDWENYLRPASVKKHLIIERGHECEDCKHSEWKSLPIPLEIHHINGDRTNNLPENLQLLCCNCHALTPNWRNKPRNESQKKIGPRVARPVNTPCSCGGLKMKSSISCKSCNSKKEKPTKIVWPTPEEMAILVWQTSSVQLAKTLGVSDVSIKKFCNKHGIKKPPIGYWSKFKIGSDGRIRTDSV